jgi:hypothetical protein
VLADISSGEWTFAAAGITAMFGFFGVIVKALLDTQKDAQTLRDNSINRLIPALEAMNAASAQVTSTAREMITALAVAQARKDDRPPYRNQR